eukprot:5836127-Prymnesium_polylepis.1
MEPFQPLEGIDGGAWLLSGEMTLELLLENTPTHAEREGGQLGRAGAGDAQGGGRRRQNVVLRGDDGGPA